MKLFYNMQKNKDDPKKFFVSYIENGEVKTDSIDYNDYFVIQKTQEAEKHLERMSPYIVSKKEEISNGKEYVKVYLKYPMAYRPTGEEGDAVNDMRKMIYSLANNFNVYEYDVYPDIIKMIYEHGIEFLSKETKINDLPYCVFDIETQTTDKQFSTPKSNFVFYIGARGVNIKGEPVKFYKSVADYTEKQEEYETVGEKAMLIDFLKFLDENKFVIISGYNIYNFDIYFIAERLKKYGIPFEFNEDEIFQNINKYREDGTQRHPMVKFQNPQYRQYISKKGRIVFFDIFYYMFRVPSERTAIKYKYGLVSLKNVCDFYNVLKKENRVLIPGAEIYNEFIKNPKYMKQYLIDDVEGTHALYEKFFPIMIFFSWYANIELGYVMDASQTQILERSLYKNMKKKHLFIFPKSRKAYTSDEIKHFGGGNVKLNASGYYTNVIKIDYSSLYPSIMLDWDIKPENDKEGIFTETLRGLYTERIHFKREAKRIASLPEKTKEDEATVVNYQNYSAALKIIINSAYGLLGYADWRDKTMPGSRFSNILAASRVTEIGRNMVTTVENVCLKKGLLIIETDTDGIIVTDPTLKTKEEVYNKIQAFTNELNAAFKKMGKKFVAIDLESVDSGMISIKKKNYILFDKENDNKISISPHGSTIVDSSKAPIIKTTIQNILDYIIDAPSMESLFKKFNFLFISSPLKKENDFIYYCNKFKPEDFFYTMNIKEKAQYKSEKDDIAQKVLMRKYIEYYKREITADIQPQYYITTSGLKTRDKVEIAENFDRTKLDYRHYLKEIKQVLITLILNIYNTTLARDANIKYDELKNKIEIKNNKVVNPYSDDAVFDKNWYKKIFAKITDEKKHKVIVNVYNHKIVGLGEKSFFRPILVSLLSPPSPVYKEYLDRYMSELKEEKTNKLRELYYNKRYKSLEDGSQEKKFIQVELTDDELFLFDSGLIEEYIKPIIQM